MEDINWSLNVKTFLDFMDNIAGSPQTQSDQANLTQNMSVSSNQAKENPKCVGKSCL